VCGGLCGYMCKDGSVSCCSSSSAREMVEGVVEGVKQNGEWDESTARKRAVS
jgi:hypothetical protein